MEKQKNKVGRPELEPKERKTLIFFGLEEFKVEKLGGRKKVKELSIQLIERYYEKHFK